jgi:hypothetical protein
MYSGNIEVLKAPQVEVTHLLELIYQGVIKPIEDREGIDCVENAMKKMPDLYDPVELTDQDKVEFQQLLQELPPLHGKITEQEARDFWEAYSNLPNRLSWMPGLRAGGEFSECTGVDCVASKLVKRDDLWLPFRLTAADKQAFAQLLTKLPPLHGRMTGDEVGAFLKQYRGLADRLAWEPSMIDDRRREIDRTRQIEIKKSHAWQLEDAIAKGLLKATTAEHEPRKYFGNGIYVTRRQALEYLDDLGLIDVLEAKYALPRSESEGSAEELGQAHLVIDGERVESIDFKLLQPYERLILLAHEMSRKDEIWEPIIDAMREAKTDNAQAIYRRLIEAAIKEDNPIFNDVVDGEIEIKKHDGAVPEKFALDHLEDRLSRLRVKDRKRLAG